MREAAERRLSRSRDASGTRSPSGRCSGSVDDPTLAHGHSDHPRLFRFSIEFGLVDNQHTDWDRQIPESSRVPYAVVMAASDDRPHHDEIDVRIRTVVAPVDGPEHHDAGCLGPVERACHDVGHPGND